MNDWLSTIQTDSPTHESMNEWVNNSPASFGGLSDRIIFKHSWATTTKAHNDQLRGIDWLNGMQIHFARLTEWMNECEETAEEETVAADRWILLVLIIIHKRLINRLEADSFFHKHQIRFGIQTWNYHLFAVGGNRTKNRFPIEYRWQRC